MKRIMLSIVCVAAVSAALAAGPDDGGSKPSGDTPAASDDAPKQSVQERIAERDRLEKKGVEFMTHYYEHPDPDGVAQIVKDLSASGWLREGRNQADLLGFLVPIFRAHPDRVAGWMEQWGDLPDDHLIALVMAVWISKIEGGDEIMMGQVKNLDESWTGNVVGYTEEEPWDPLTMAEPKAYQLELLWGWYCGSGDERCLERMLFFTGDARKFDNLAEEATTSLSYNAAVHPSVRKWCERELKKEKTDPEHALAQAEQLEGILEDADYIYENREALKLSDFGFPRD